MGRLTKKQLEKLHSSTIYLLKRTTWRCGRVERAIINYLKKKLSLRGEAKASVGEILQISPVRKETYASLRRLRRRRIIKFE